MSEAMKAKLDELYEKMGPEGRSLADKLEVEMEKQDILGKTIITASLVLSNIELMKADGKYEVIQRCLKMIECASKAVLLDLIVKTKPAQASMLMGKERLLAEHATLRVQLANLVEHFGEGD